MVEHADADPRIVDHKRGRRLIGKDLRLAAPRTDAAQQQQPWCDKRARRHHEQSAGSEPGGAGRAGLRLVQAAALGVVHCERRAGRIEVDQVSLGVMQNLKPRYRRTARIDSLEIRADRPCATAVSGSDIRPAIDARPGEWLARVTFNPAGLGVKRMRDQCRAGVLRNTISRRRIGYRDVARIRPKKASISAQCHPAGQLASNTCGGLV